MSDRPYTLTVAEVAAELNISKKRVYKLIETGWFATLPGPGTFAVLTASVDAYKAQAEAAIPAQQARPA